MDPFHGETPLTSSVSSKGIRTPHQTNLNLTVSEEPGNSVLLPVSGFNGVFTEKGPLIAGFSRKLSHFSEISCFSGNDWIRVKRDRIRCQKGPDPVGKVKNAVHLRPWRPWSPWLQGTWSYPTLTPDHLCRLLATGRDQPKIQEQSSSFAAAVPLHPLVIEPLSPGGRFYTVDGRVGDG